MKIFGAIRDGESVLEIFRFDDGEDRAKYFLLGKAGVAAEIGDHGWQNIEPVAYFGSPATTDYDSSFFLADPNLA